MEEARLAGLKVILNLLDNWKYPGVVLHQNNEIWQAGCDGKGKKSVEQEAAAWAYSNTSCQRHTMRHLHGQGSEGYND